MDVKDVLSSKPVQTKPVRDVASQDKSQRSAAPITSLIADATRVAPQAVQIDTRTRGNIKTELRAKVNEAINVTNVASEATSEISNLVKSIDGIVEQVKDKDISDQRRAILEKEANSLVEEIKRTAQKPASNGIKPLSGEKIRLEVEERIGRTLEIILPDDAKNAFDIGKLEFSTKDTIISTIANVEAAEQSIKRLRDAVDSASKAVADTAASVEVALQNSEASETSIRDVDEALKLAGETRVGIGSDPEKALHSVGKLDSSALGLLD